MEKECCCVHCYKRNVCVGCTWNSDMCDKDRATCTFYKLHKTYGDCILGESGDDKGRHE